MGSFCWTEGFLQIFWFGLVMWFWFDGIAVISCCFLILSKGLFCGGFLDGSSTMFSLNRFIISGWWVDLSIEIWSLLFGGYFSLILSIVIDMCLNGQKE